MGVMSSPPAGDTWLAVTAEPMPVDEAAGWAVLPGCGAVVLFSGTVRDHAEGRTGVTHLTYEAYEEAVVPVLAGIAEEMRTRWPSVGRIAMLHRVGRLELCESSVVVVVSAAHRDEAFAACRYGIDTLKSTAPIWKRESWEDGDDWATGAQELPGEAPAVTPRIKQ